MTMNEYHISADELQDMYDELPMSSGSFDTTELSRQLDQQKPQPLPKTETTPVPIEVTPEKEKVSPPILQMVENLLRGKGVLKNGSLKDLVGGETNAATEDDLAAQVAVLAAVIARLSQLAQPEKTTPPATAEPDTNIAQTHRHYLDMLKSMFAAGLQPIDRKEITKASAELVLTEAAQADLAQVLPHILNHHNDEVAGILKLAAVKSNDGIARYAITQLRLTDQGNDSIVLVDDTPLQAGEIEWHSHTIQRYLDTVSNGDLMTAVESPPWIDSQTGAADPAIRVFAVLSVHQHNLLAMKKPHRVSIQLYRINLRDVDILARYRTLASTAYGLQQLGEPIVVTV